MILCSVILWDSFHRCYSKYYDSFPCSEIHPEKKILVISASSSWQYPLKSWEISTDEYFKISKVVICVVWNVKTIIYFYGDQNIVALMTRCEMNITDISKNHISCWSDLEISKINIPPVTRYKNIWNAWHFWISKRRISDENTITNEFQVIILGHSKSRS